MLNVVNSSLTMPKFVTGFALIAASVFIWSKVNRFLIKKRAEVLDRMQYDLVVDITGSPEGHPWGLEMRRQIVEKGVQGLTICVLGDFKVGKTFLINRLCGLDLPSSESEHTRGLSIKRAKGPYSHFLWIDTAGHGAPYDVRTETPQERNSIENLVNDLAYHLADIHIVVVSNCKLRDQELIYSIQRSMKADNQPGRDVLLVVHNYCRTSDPDILYGTFNNDVISRFNVEELSVPFLADPVRTKRVWVDRGGSYPIYHLLLGKENTPAGNRFNENTYRIIFDLCVSRLGFRDTHMFIDDILYLLNGGLLRQHLYCERRVKCNEQGTRIVIDYEPSTTTSSTVAVAGTYDFQPVVKPSSAAVQPLAETRNNSFPSNNSFNGGVNAAVCENNNNNSQISAASATAAFQQALSQMTQMGLSIPEMFNGNQQQQQQLPH